MRARTVAAVVVAVAVVVAGCASEPALAPPAPTGPALGVSALGNPPPPRVLGKIIATFTTVAASRAKVAQTFTFRGPALYNRDTLSGTHFLELTATDGSIRANAAGVIKASGIAVLTDASTGATLTVDLSQLIGFSGPLFLPCPPGSPVACFVFTANLSGTIRLSNGTIVPAVGSLRFRWEFI